MKVGRRLGMAHSLCLTKGTVALLNVEIQHSQDHETPGLAHRPYLLPILRRIGGKTVQKYVMCCLFFSSFPWQAPARM